VLRSKVKNKPKNKLRRDLKRNPKRNHPKRLRKKNLTISTRNTIISITKRSKKLQNSD
jgi:hypothetical protein